MNGSASLPASQVGQPKPRLPDQVRDAIRARHYSRRTEKSYVAWIRRYIFFHDKRHPAEMDAEEIRRFPTALAVDRKVAASTQNQALSALLFLYQVVLQREVPWIDRVVRAKSAHRLPVVLTRDEVRAVLGHLHGVPRLMAMLLYGAGLRLLECARLRVKDLIRHLEQARRQHLADLQRGGGWVELPDAQARKYPHAGREWAWQWIFPATRIYVDRVTGQRRRHHLHEPVVQRAVKEAVRVAGLAKRASCHTLCHSFATHLLRGWLRHPNSPGASRPPGRRHDNDLHARAQPGSGCGAQPGGQGFRSVTGAHLWPDGAGDAGLDCSANAV